MNKYDIYKLLGVYSNICILMKVIFVKHFFCLKIETKRVGFVHSELHLNAHLLDMVFKC